MLAAPLPTVELNPEAAPTAVVIWMHGLGADGHDFEPIVPHLGLPPELAIRFVFPHAPEMAISAFAGQKARAWFDFNPDGGADLTGLKSSVAKIHDLIQNEVDNGIPTSRIVLAGFSQGGVLALETALHYPRPLAGILALSTFMADTGGLDSATAQPNASIPILMCHGVQDAVLPMSLGKTSCATLREAGYEVDWREYPMGHEVCMQEITHIGAWLQLILQ